MNIQQPQQQVLTDGDKVLLSSSVQPFTSSTPKGTKLKKEKKRKKKKKRPPHKSKMVTGYIIYASEIRKDIIKKYPNRDFGDISKIVGVEWKNLPQETKLAFEKRAQEANAKSKAIAAEALELKKLADAAEERAREHELSLKAASQQQQQQQQLPNSCNGLYQTNGHSQSITNSHNHQLSSYESSNSPIPSVPQSPVQQMQSHTKYGVNQQPLHIIQQQQQQIATTVQYCSHDNGNNNCTSQQSYHPSQSPSLQQIQYQRNNIVYRKPATVKLRPKDATTQTEPTVWLKLEPKKPLRFSQKFIDYLNNNRHLKSTDEHQQPSMNGTNQLSSPETNDSAYSSTIV